MENSVTFPSSPICPHLGMKNDPGTSFRYPTLGNYCFHCKSASVPRVEHQEAYCFGAYQDCPAYGQPAERTLPLRFRARIYPHRSRPRLNFAVLAMVVPLLAFLGWKTLRSEAASLPEPSTYIIPVSGSETLTAVNTPSPPPSKTLIPPTPTHAQPDALQQAALQSRGHILEIPFTVGEYSFLIHRVRAGESFSVLEVTYVTQSRVILALNHSLAAPLQANSVIVIVPGLQSVDAELPAFEPYQISDEEITVAELAETLEVDAARLGYYNNCTRSSPLAAGEWVIVPQE